MHIVPPVIIIKIRESDNTGAGRGSGRLYTDPEGETSDGVEGFVGVDVTVMSSMLRRGGGTMAGGT